MPKYTIIEKLRSPQGETVVRSFVEAENEEKAVELIHNDFKKDEELSAYKPYGEPKIKLYEEGDEYGPIEYEPPTVEYEPPTVEQLSWLDAWEEWSEARNRKEKKESIKYTILFLINLAVALMWIFK